MPSPKLGLRGEMARFFLVNYNALNLAGMVTGAALHLHFPTSSLWVKCFHLTVHFQCTIGF